MVKLRNILLLFFILFFAACSSKQERAEYNKPALYWYNKMLNQIAFFDLDAADDTYTSLESEHRNSPLIPTALIILANAHMEDEAYSLANFYLDEYIKRFTLSDNIDYARYLKIKANFIAFKYQLREQTLIEETTALIAEYKVQHAKSPYMPLVDTINSRLFMAKALLDKSIADLYAKLDKKQGAKLYTEKVKKSWVDIENIEPAPVPFYRYIFE